jgi:hypothetical protein
MSDFDHFIGTRAVTDKHAFDVAALSRLAGRATCKASRGR